MTSESQRITVGELAVRFLELQGTRAAFGVKVDMKAWGPLAAKFAGPIVKKD